MPLVAGVSGSGAPFLQGRVLDLGNDNASPAVGSVGIFEAGLNFYNSSGSTIVAGTVVYVSGYTAAKGATVTKADADAAGSKVMYFVAEDTLTLTRGVMVEVGRIVVAGLDTSGAAVGDAVYLTTTAGVVSLSGTVGVNPVVGYVATLANPGAVYFNADIASGGGGVPSLLWPDGTVGAPGGAFAADTNTGIWRPAADTIAWSLGGKGVYAMGTTSPSLAAPADTVGQDVYFKASDAGATPTAARVGALLSWAAGAGSAAATTVVAGAGGAASYSAGAGGAKTGTTGAAGAGGTASLLAGAGGSNAATTSGAAGAGGGASIAGGAGGANTGAGSSGAGGVGGNAGVNAGAGGAASGAGSTGNGGIGGSVTGTAGAGGATVGGTSGNGGVVLWTAGAGAAQANAVVSGQGGAASLVAGAGGANTGAASGQAGGTGGGANVTAGVGGATNSTGAHNGGTGGAVTLTAAVGGAASAGTGNGGAGGGLLGIAGAGGASTGGTGGAGGAVAVTGGAGGASNGAGGNITITPGAANGSGRHGVATVTGLQNSSRSSTIINGARTLSEGDSGGVFTVAQSSAYDIDLPSPTAGAGLRFIFQLVSPGAFNVTLTVLSGAATFEGTIINDVTSVIPATGATLTFASGTAALGDNIEVISTATDKYFVRAVTQAAGGITIA